MIIDWCRPQKSKKYKGMGLFATRDIPAGTIVIIEESCPNCTTVRESELDDFGPKMKAYLLEHLPVTRLSHPLFLKFCDDRIGFINHSCDANVLEAFPYYNDICVRDIRKGEEITYDYRLLDDDGVHYDCLCGSQDCVGFVTCQWPAPDAIVRMWMARITEAVKRMPRVEQPLEQYIIRKGWKGMLSEFYREWAKKKRGGKP